LTSEEGKKMLELFAQDGNRYFFCSDSESETDLWFEMIKSVTENLMSEALYHSHGESVR